MTFKLQPTKMIAVKNQVKQKQIKTTLTFMKKQKNHISREIVDTFILKNKEKTQIRL